MTEKRSVPRKRVLKAGTIAFGGAVIDCTVRNLTASGALLEVESLLGVPPRFVLVVPSDGISRSCRMIWASERRIGIRFECPDAAATNQKEGSGP